MPTLEELFKSKQLPSQGGQTAEEAYAVQNSKDIRISAADPFVNTVGMSLARGARKLLGVRGSETLLEEEVTGVRIIRSTSAPFIYGSELARLTLRTTPLLDTMKSAANGDLGGGGALGNAISKGRDFVNDKLGIPSSMIPTKIVSDDRITQKGETQNRMIDLAEIKGSAEGSLLGKFLKDGGGGNLKTIGKQALGSAINLAKDKVRGKLFGERSTTGFNTADPSKLGSNISYNYGSLDNSVGITLKTDPQSGNIDVQGLMYSKTFNLTVRDKDDNNEKLSFIDVSDEGGLGAKTPELVIDRSRFSANPDRIPKGMISKRGIDTKSDSINASSVYTDSEAFSEILAGFDFVPLKFKSIHTGKAANFRATISGLSESFSPSWSGGKFVGSPFSYYTYDGVERTVSFNFKVFALNSTEHKNAWDKLNFVQSLVYPQGYYTTSAIVPPFIQFDLGDMFRKKLCFIDSLSFTYDDNTPWQVTDSETTFDGVEENMKGYRLPMVTDVSITLKFLLSRASTSAKRFYSFEPQSN
jgi:hypothetical protein